MAALLDIGIFSIEDTTGAILPGATLTFYVTGTTTPLATYTDRALGTPNTNPVVAGSDGRFGPVWLQAADYKIVLKSASGSTLKTMDPVSAIPFGLTDPNVDAFAGWDDSAGATIWFTPDSTITTSGTTFGVATEGVQDMIAAFLAAGAGITLTYNDAGNALTVAVDAATAAQYRSKTSNKVLTADKAFDAAAYVVLTDAATVAVDMATGFNFTLTLAGSHILGNPTNTKDGQTGCIAITQDATGSRLLTYGANWEFAGGSAPVLSTVAGTKDLLFYQVLGATSVYASLVKGVV